MSVIRMVGAVVLFLIGVVWIGQGTGMIGGSAMSGSTFWAVVGAVLVLIALGLVVTGLASRREASVDDER